MLVRTIYGERGAHATVSVGCTVLRACKDPNATVTPMVAAAPSKSLCTPKLATHFTTGGVGGQIASHHVRNHNPIPRRTNVILSC